MTSAFILNAHRDDHRLADHVAASYKRFLHQGHLLRSNVQAQNAARHNDGGCSLQDGLCLKSGSRSKMSQDRLCLIGTRVAVVAYVLG